jgi:hypothetical protein
MVVVTRGVYREQGRKNNRMNFLVWALTGYKDTGGD